MTVFYALNRLTNSLFCLYNYIYCSLDFIYVLSLKPQKILIRRRVLLAKVQGLETLTVKGQVETFEVMKIFCVLTLGWLRDLKAYQN